MSVGLTVSKGEIDSRAGDIARRFQQGFEDVLTMKRYPRRNHRAGVDRPRITGQ